MTQQNQNVTVSIQAPILFFGDFRFRLSMPPGGPESPPSKERSRQWERPPYALPAGTTGVVGLIPVATAAGWSSF